MPDPIVAFYRGEAPDSMGRRIETIWAWDNQKLEAVHDYIQWLFPNSRPSPVNPSAPLVTRETMAAFAEDAELRARLLHSLDRMLSFYGLVRSVDDAGGVEIRPGSNYHARRANWLRPGNHNHLRLTRILIALQLLGLPREAEALRDGLRAIYETEGPDRIDERTFQFWMKAGG